MTISIMGCSTLAKKKLHQASSQEDKVEIPANTEETLVYKKDDVIYYKGGVSAEANQKVRNLIDSKTHRLFINSEGGDILLGMELGDLVYHNQLDVEVGDFCFSSCANYVFVAGKTKWIHEKSQIGWHGGAYQVMDFTNDPSMQSAYEAYIKPAQQKETAFFQKIGVKQVSTTYGQHAQFDKYSDCVGWTYSLKAMSQLGITNVYLLDKVWHPSGSFQGKCIFEVTETK